MYVYVYKQWVSFWSVANESTAVLHQRNDTADVNAEKKKYIIATVA